MKRKRSSVSLKSFIGKVNEEIRENYTIEKVLGEGAFSVVYKATQKITNLSRCIKKIQKANFTKDQNESLMNEIKVLSLLDHPHVVKIIEYYESARSLYIVTEFLEGQELFDKIQQVDHFSEDQARKVMKQILSALAYMYKKNIVHRDLKPENIIVEELPNGELNAKIIDFGTSKQVKYTEKMKCKMGTPYYIAPEVIQQNYDISCDIWSVGIIMYILFCGYPPFNGSTDEKIMKRIQNGKFEFPVEEWGEVSKEAKTLIKRMLNMDPKLRPTAQELLIDKWFQIKIENKNLISKEYLEKLKNFKITSKLRSAIHLYFINYFDLKNERIKMQQIFEDLDIDGDGQLTRQELILAYEKAYGLQGKDLAKQILNKLDFSETQSIDFSEFLVASFDPESLKEEHIQKIFAIVDQDKNGQIDEKELMEFFHFKLDQQSEAQEMIDEADTNHDGMISYEEFKNLFDKQFNI